MVEGTDKYTIFSSLEKSNDPNMIMPPFGRECKKCYLLTDIYLMAGKSSFVNKRKNCYFSFVRD